MPETFFILLAGGIMLATAIPDPREVTLLWLRLGGIIALSLTGLSAYFYYKDRSSVLGASFAPMAILAFLPVLFGVLWQLAATQLGWRKVQRAFAIVAYIAALWATLWFQNCITWASAERSLATLLAYAGVAAMTGIVLMDMLLGHAYLTASKMSMRPFVRLNAALGIATLLRLVTATAGVYILNRMHPVPMLWEFHGLLMLTRWLVGLALPLVFIYMTHDCIQRRATQSATGILYVCGVLVFIGEMIALPLIRDTGLPF